MPDESMSEQLGGAGLLEFSAELVQQFGGIPGLVSKFRDVWDDDRTSAAVKNQIAMFVAKTISDAQELRGKSDYTRMTDDELEQAAIRLIEKHKGRLPWKKESDNVAGDGDSQGTEEPLSMLPRPREGNGGEVKS